MNNQVNPSAINKSLNCSGCGALLHFNPGTHNLLCDYCGVSNVIEDAPDSRDIAPYDYEEFVAGIDNNKQSADLKVVNCKNCGSQTILDQFVTSDKCPFCTAPLVLDLESGQQYVPPHYILPFAVTQQQGIEFFKKWLKSLWWAPNDLAKKVSDSSSALKGVYLPHWTYDTYTVTDYSGERGDYYYTTETYTETVNGETQTKTRRVRHTSWSYTAGTVECDFRDLMVPASKSLPEKTLNKLGPWNFNMLVKFDERYMSGFRSETYQLDPEQGFVKATEQTTGEINSAIRDDIGGDEQRIDSTDTQYLDKAIKYLMLPVWVSAYNYNNKIYQFTVNASTGEVIGQRPVSAIKIILAVLLLIALIIIGVVLYQNAHPNG
jgi:LSD1 subclass zinc finger protein